MSTRARERGTRPHRPLTVALLLPLALTACGGSSGSAGSSDGPVAPGTEATSSSSPAEPTSSGPAPATGPVLTSYGAMMHLAPGYTPEKNQEFNGQVTATSSDGGLLILTTIATYGLPDAGDLRDTVKQDVTRFDLPQSAVKPNVTYAGREWAHVAGVSGLGSSGTYAETFNSGYSYRGTDYVVGVELTAPERDRAGLESMMASVTLPDS